MTQQNRDDSLDGPVCIASADGIYLRPNLLLRVVTAKFLRFSRRVIGLEEQPSYEQWEFR